MARQATDPSRVPVLSLVLDPGLARTVAGLAATAAVPLRELRDSGQVGDLDVGLIVLDVPGARRWVTGGGPVRATIPVVVVADAGDAAADPAADLVGARRVARLPGAEAWLVAAMADTLEPDVTRALTVAVAGACGGAGASVVAACLAQAAVAGPTPEPVLLLDADPRSCGLDLLLAAEDQPGARWPALAEVRGRLAAGHLPALLPRVDGVDLLSADRTGRPRPVGEALHAVLDAVGRGYGRVVADVGAGGGEAAEELVLRSDQLVLVVPPGVRPLASARTRLQAWLHQGVLRPDNAAPGAAIAFTPTLARSWDLGPSSAPGRAAPSGVERQEPDGGRPLHLVLRAGAGWSLAAGEVVLRETGVPITSLTRLGRQQWVARAVAAGEPPGLRRPKSFLRPGHRLWAEVLSVGAGPAARGPG